MNSLKTLRIVTLATVLALPAAAAQNTPPGPPVLPRSPQTDSGGLAVDRVIAVVGDRPVLLSELTEELSERRARGLKIPTDSAEWMETARGVLQEMID